MKRPTALLLVALTLGLAALGFTIQNTDEHGLIVHEWGTFTCLQDEAGQAIGGINTDDEPVPAFVHDLAGTLLIRATELPPVFFNKGAPGCHPDVTMRLETPVIYFHLPKSQTKPLTLDVNVEFRGGWLTQFYPSAEAVAPGVESGPKFGHVRSDTVGRLAWAGLTVGGDADGPATTERVWTSPRAVQAASVTTTDHESEKFLFYRGVGHIDAPLQVTRDTTGDQLVLRSRFDPALDGKSPVAIRHLWLTEIRPDGACAFRQLKPVTLTGAGNEVLATTPAAFAADEFSTENPARFRAEMHRALVEEGLFDDEAGALLNTWGLAYFKSPGLRLFFLVPRAWTDDCLPLKISVPADVHRVMMGRIELVTPAQRELLAEIAAGPAPDMQLFNQALREIQSKLGSNQGPFNSVFSERAPIACLGVSIPEAYWVYLNLGRFRNALILDEQRRRPTDALARFIEDSGLKAYEIPSH
jgi:hypothetical protein